MYIVYFFNVISIDVLIVINWLANIEIYPNDVYFYLDLLEPPLVPKKLVKGPGS